MLGTRKSSTQQAAVRLEGFSDFARRHDLCGQCRRSRLVIAAAPPAAG
jgi:hypothetical protein